MSPSEKYLLSCALPFDSQKCVIESPTNTTLAPPFVTVPIFSAWRFTCQLFAFPPYMSCETARIVANADATLNAAAIATIVFFIFGFPFY